MNFIDANYMFRIRVQRLVIETENEEEIQKEKT